MDFSAGIAAYDEIVIAIATFERGIAVLCVLIFVGFINPPFCTKRVVIRTAIKGDVFTSCVEDVPPAAAIECLISS